jgi:hypothetical protein
VRWRAWLANLAVNSRWKRSVERESTRE